MEVILDETSLLPCPVQKPAERIQVLAAAMKALDSLGCGKVLRTVRDAAQRDIGTYQGLKHWCFDRETDKDAGRFLASRLVNLPYIDEGPFAQVEGRGRAIEGMIDGQIVIGLCYAALTQSPSVALGSAKLTICHSATVQINTLVEEGITSENEEVWRMVTADDVQHHGEAIRQQNLCRVKDGQHLMQRACDLFPLLRFGAKAQEQIQAINGNELYFQQLLRHLHALNLGAERWQAGRYSPGNHIQWSSESNATLQHGIYGAQRNFPMPDGFEPPCQWSDHTKISVEARRIYFMPRRIGGENFVGIGYFGQHLPTVKHG